MKQVTLFIAISLDGYIADRLGGVDWLSGTGTEDTDSYDAFIRGIDTVIMGGNTYRQIITQLSPETWPYPELESYVVTRHSIPDGKNKIHLVQESPCALVQRLRKQDGKGIWICGGADLARQLMAKDLIDRYHLSVIPTLLGDGIPLFSPGLPTLPLQLIYTQSYNGIIDLVYERRFDPSKRR